MKSKPKALSLETKIKGMLSLGTFLGAQTWGTDFMEWLAELDGNWFWGQDFLTSCLITFELENASLTLLYY